MKKSLLLIFLMLGLSSCKNYSASKLTIDGDSVITTAIPVIRKDPNGYLRNYIAREMSYTNSLYYKDRGAKYQLLVTITEDTNSKISYMWDRDPVTNGNLGVFYPTEGMKEVIAKVELIDRKTGSTVIEPFFVKAEAIYDFVNPTVPDTVEFQTAFGGDESILQYSLGQVDSELGAKEATYNPVYQRLAKKIVSRIMKSPVKS